MILGPDLTLQGLDLALKKIFLQICSCKKENKTPRNDIYNDKTKNPKNPEK